MDLRENKSPFAFPVIEEIIEENYKLLKKIVNSHGISFWAVSEESRVHLGHHKYRQSAPNCFVSRI